MLNNITCSVYNVDGTMIDRLILSEELFKNSLIVFEILERLKLYISEFSSRDHFVNNNSSV